MNADRANGSDHGAQARDVAVSVSAAGGDSSSPRRAAVSPRLAGGPCITVGDDVNTDVVIPGRYLVSIDPVELAQHAFEPLGPEFQERLRRSKVLVAGRNFGCGSAREQAASCLVGAGIEAVVARSFARVFFRNAINSGLLAVECPEAVDRVADGDDLWVDDERGVVEVGEDEYDFPPYPENLRQILASGGLIPFLVRQLDSKGGA